MFSAGIRPRDQLARDCGLEVAERGGVLVDEQCRTNDPAIYAIGECAAPGGRMYGLVAPGYQMAEVVVDALLDGPGAFTGADMSTKLKLLGVDVASFGDAFATTDGALELVFADAVAGVYKKLVVSDDGRRLLGGILVGDASAYGLLRPLVSSGMELPANPEELILPAARGTAQIGDARRGRGLLLQQRHQGQRSARPSTSRAARTSRAPRRAPAPAPPAAPASRWSRTCSPSGSRPPDAPSRPGSASTSTSHRQELFDLVAVHGYRRFDDIVEAHGRGRGCDVCKPAIASHPGQPVQRARPRRRHLGAPGHQRQVPRQHPAQRHLLRGAAGARRRDHPREADRDRRGGPRLRALHEDHRRPADRPVRRPDGGAAGDLAAARRRRLRVRPRLRQVAADREVLRRARPGAGTACRTRPAWRSCSRSATAGCARRTSSRAESAAAPASAPRPAARTSG